MVGAALARTLCPRLGLSAAETETVVWLVEHHLPMSTHRLQPRHRRPQDHPRLRRHRAEPGAAAAAAGADGGRHPRRRAQRLERLEGPAAARALLRDRAAAVGRPHAAGRARAHRRARRRPSAAAVADWPPEEVERFIGRHYPDYWLRTDTARRSSTPSSCRAPRRRASKFASDLHAPTPSPPSPSCRSSRPTIRACCRCSPAPAPPPAPTSSAPTSPRRATASRSTPSCWRASSTSTRTSCAAPRRIAETIEKLLKGDVRAART